MGGSINIGTSSWSDPGFVEEWYPAGLPARDRLPYYAERFDAVEVNSTFYAVPAASQVERWAEITPDGFTFDVKLHRLLSRHSAALDSLPKPLRERAKTGSRGRVRLDERLEQALADAVLDAVAPLADAGKLATFLLQLSPAFSPHAHSLDELESLVERLAPHPVAIELRHRSWTTRGRLEPTLGWMEEHGAVWVGVDAPRGRQITIMPPVDAVTNPAVAYLRAHGRNAEGYVRGRSVAERFAYRYADEELEEIGARARELAAGAEQVRLHFNNNRGSDAPVAAERMRELLGQGVSA
ncbi:MAG TPA: DUF72 domain-containing protein [Solirubrobacteraceae bacterium]|nr:DUF72 domain-containing protein [Solirubrobacteraceae bacterium]